MKFELQVHKEFYQPIRFAKLKKNLKKKSYSTLFLDENVLRWKNQKTLQKPHFGNVGASDLRFYSIALKFGPQVHKEF